MSKSRPLKILLWAGMLGVLQPTWFNESALGTVFQQSKPSRVIRRPSPPSGPSFIYMDLLVPRETRLKLYLDHKLDSVNSRQGDPVELRLAHDVRAAGRVAIPAGTVVKGVVTNVRRPGRVLRKARLSVKVETLHLAGGPEIPLEATELSLKGGSTVGRNIQIVGYTSAIAAVTSRSPEFRKHVRGGAIIGGVLSLMTRGPDIFLRRGTVLSFELKRGVKLSVTP